MWRQIRRNRRQHTDAKARAEASPDYTNVAHESDNQQQHSSMRSSEPVVGLQIEDSAAKAVAQTCSSE